MHSLLLRQLRRHNGSPTCAPDRWDAFLQSVNDAYAGFDDDRVRRERSMDLMSKELTQRYEELQADIAKRAEIEMALRESEARLREEIADRERVETELRLKQKLEAVGQLAAGIAHEINTPVQYVSDSIYFLREATRDYHRLLLEYRSGLANLEALASVRKLQDQLRGLEEAMDLEYLDEQVPRAFERVLEGTGRVTSIVRAVKEFAHPDQREMAAAELNRALESTLMVARNEYKYVAEVITDFGDLPPVECHIGDLNQVFLNLIVNAAHAIADARAGEGPLGKITVRTRHDATRVLVSVADTGTGIPPEVRDRVFDPFFSTKAVGQGTGQGLAIARSIVVDKHGGEIWFETEPGVGTTFHVRLDIERNKQVAA